MYTENSALLGSAPNGWQTKAVSYILARPDANQRRANGYSDADVSKIVQFYSDACQSTVLDPLIAVSQMIHETGALTSWWSARPRRNMSGYGVTGKSRTTDPHDIKRWVQVEKGRWLEGCSFPTVKEAVEITVGRLLAYAMPLSKASPGEQNLIYRANDWRWINIPIFASSPKLLQLGAKRNLRNIGKPREQWSAGWAWPGDEYGQSLATIANAILSTP